MRNRLIAVLKNPYKLVAFLGVRGQFKWMPDKIYLSIYFRAVFNRKINWENPGSFNEKIQWLKLNDRNPEYSKIVDKYEVKKIIADKIGDEYIIPTLGVWDKFEEIDFKELPSQFVLKCTHDSGGIFICRNKNSMDISKARKKISRCLKRRFYYQTREWPYKNIKPRIIAEHYLENKEGLIDYKFYCFCGEPRFLYISKGMENHKTARISFLTLEWEFAPFQRKDYQTFEQLPEKPIRYEEMLDVARKLSKDYSFVRVDLYEINGQVYFSELTLYPCGGFMPFDVDGWDDYIGEMMDLPTEKKLV